MDTGVKPGDDFFDYVNGAWYKRTEIAPDRTFAGIDSVLNDQIERDVRAIIEDSAKDPAANGRLGQQIGDLYASWMDEARRAARHGAAQALSRQDRGGEIARRAGRRCSPSRASIRRSASTSMPISRIRPAIPSMPAKAASACPTAIIICSRARNTTRYRAAYRDYITRSSELAGIPNAAAKPTASSRSKPRSPRSTGRPSRAATSSKIYNPMTRAQLSASRRRSIGTARWPRRASARSTRWWSTRQARSGRSGKLLASVPLDTWKDWLAFHFVSGNAHFLPKAFDDASFNFYSKTLRDVPSSAPLEARRRLVNGALGEGVGQIYVAAPLSAGKRPADGRADRQHPRRAAGEDRDQQLDGRADARPALAKLAAFDPRIGHPVKYIDYSSLEVKRDDLLGNAMRSEDFDWKLLLSRLPKPVDRSLWGMLPQTNNAYYDPTQNQITFPAAILQPPYFDPNADPAANYGSIGATIGHEIGHGFDDQGRKFDAHGPLARLVDAGHGQALHQRTPTRWSTQYNGYEPVPGVHIKGELTLGENIGDLGGLEVAYAAYRRYVAKHGEPPVIDGLTGDQRFFIAYGYSWETKQREGALRAQLLTNEHSPAKYRVNGIVRNVDAWYKAFNVQPGDKLYLPPEQRVHIW